MDNMYYYEQGRAVPGAAQKPIKGGRLKGMTDINPMWRIKKLTELFGAAGIGWYVEKLGERVHDLGDEKIVEMEINLYVKAGDEWSRPIYGTGGSKLYASENNGMYADDEAFKKAYTDAISVACKALGIGADVYFSRDESKYQQDEKRDGYTLDELCTVCINNGVDLGKVAAYLGKTADALTVADLESALTQKFGNSWKF